MIYLEANANGRATTLKTNRVQRVSIESKSIGRLIYSTHRGRQKDKERGERTAVAVIQIEAFEGEGSRPRKTNGVTRRDTRLNVNINKPPYARLQPVRPQFLSLKRTHHVNLPIEIRGLDFFEESQIEKWGKEKLARAFAHTVCESLSR